MLDKETKEAINFLAKQKKLESLKQEVEYLENEIFKNKHGFDKKKLDELKDYFSRGLK